MNIMTDVVLNVVLMVFPILIYFIYNCYRELRCEKYNKILFNLSLITSLYLCLKYGNIESNNKILLFTNIPILIAYLKKEPTVAFTLSLITIVYSYDILNQNIIINIIKFISFLLIYIIGNKRKIKDNTFILLIAVLQGFFVSTEYYLSYQIINALSILQLLLVTIIFYLIPIILMHLLNLAENITSLYLTVSELEKDKQLKNSLFKITHEVKNPIAVCKGYLDMLDPKNEDKIKRYIPIIRQEIDRSLNIMSDFMEFSKIKIDNEILDINVLLEEIIEELDLIIDSKNIKMTSRITKDEIFINGDYNRLKQVFVNLIKNSMESIEHQGKIDITTHILKEKYYIEITDNGCGMDEYTLSKIKELFFTTKQKGSGVGVSLSTEIIKAHNGEIDYYSKVGQGTKVVVKLPITMI